MTVLCFWQFCWSLSWHLLTAIYPCPVVNFHISGTKWAPPGTQDIMGRFRDDPGHSGTVDKPIYDVGVSCDAKSQLITDIRGLNLDIDMPHVPEWRDSGNDIFTLITFLDEYLKLMLLPCYVMDNPDLLPSSRLYEEWWFVSSDEFNWKMEIWDQGAKYSFSQSWKRHTPEGSKCSSSVQPTVSTVVKNDSSRMGMSGQPRVPACTSIDGDMMSRNLGRQPGNAIQVYWIVLRYSLELSGHRSLRPLLQLFMWTGSLLIMMIEMLNRSRSIGQCKVLKVNAKLRISLSCLGLNSRHNTQLISSAPRNVVSAETD